MAFHKAVKHESKLRLALDGPSGSGKTYTALSIATALADGQGVALIDTERGSASKYADLFSFDVENLTAPYHPDRFVELIQEAAAAYAVVIIDSLSHAWNGTGGLLEIVQATAKRKYGGNTYAAWSEATPIQERMMDTITSAKAHIIATMRSKQDYAQTQDDKGKMVIKKLGMAPIQRDGVEYEFDVFGDMTMDNELMIQKSRCSALAGQIIAKPGAQVAETLKAWLSGVDPWEAPRALAKSLNYTAQQWQALTKQQTTNTPETALAFLQQQARRVLNEKAAEQESEEDAHLIPDEQLETALVHLHDELRRFPAD